MNTAILMGRLTYEPELKSTQNGVSFIRFQLAVDRKYQSQGQERQSDFIDCLAWRKTAEFISHYFHKGSMIAVEGSIQTNNYIDRDGNKRKSVEIVVDETHFCGSKAENQGNTNPNFSKPEPAYSPDVNSDFEEIIDDDDDLPF